MLGPQPSPGENQGSEKEEPRPPVLSLFGIEEGERVEGVRDPRVKGIQGPLPDGQDPEEQGLPRLVTVIARQDRL